MTDDGPRAMAGLHLPVYPMRGYSLTFPVGSSQLQRSVTLSHRKVVLARIGERIRIAGFSCTAARTGAAGR